VKSEILVAHIVTKLLRIGFTIIGIIIIGYIFVTFVDVTINYAKTWSWFVKIPVFIAFAVLFMLLSLVAAAPLFWLDSVKRHKKGWLGNFYLVIEQDNASKTKNLFKRYRGGIFNLLVFGLLLFGYFYFEEEYLLNYLNEYFGFQKGFLLTYLNVSAYVIFVITLCFTYLICSHLLEWRQINLLRSSETTGVRHQNRLLKYADNSFVRTLIAAVIFFSFYYIVHSANDFLLLTFSDRPYHVLFPCSESIVMTEEMKQEAVRFYGKKFFEDFNCGGDTTKVREGF